LAKGSAHPGAPAVRGGALRSGVAVALATIAVSGSGAVAAALLGHEFGRDAETDGFLAAYGVYLVLVLAAQAFRLVLVPDFTRAAADGRIGSELVGYVGAVLVFGGPATAAAIVFADGIGGALTGGPSDDAANAAAQAVPWLVAAALGQLVAAVLAAALAAVDSYVAAAWGYALGAAVALAVFVALEDAHGIVSLAWGVAANAVVTVAIPAAALIRAKGLRRGRRAVGLGRRVARLGEAAAVPLALQALFVVALRAAAGLGEGNQTSLTYAYVGAAAIVAATASSIAAVAAAPLTRRGVEGTRAAEYVVHASWLSLVVVGLGSGVLAVAGADVARVALGPEFGGDVGAELGRLVVVLAPWAVATVAFSLVFPLLFVVGRTRVLVPAALAVVAVHVPIALALRALLDLEGLALALAVSTALLVGVLLAAVSTETFVKSVAGVSRAAAVVALAATASFAAPALLLDGVAAAAVGAIAYAAVLAAVRPRGLLAAWRYLRVLHD
jgi:hypothetical protein